ncbi:hypothetical protein [Candidatus Palauibacter sp.]|uniref:AbiU2 domain-containing protein n=1 Tax=Candidatus Palauibacter sp. TaxID=3101350 RepID=UPI003B5AA649
MDATRRDFEQEMGRELGSLYWVLWNDWANALLRYKELSHLFNETELGPLNRIGGTFLWDVQQVFVDDLILRICRMTDKPSVGDENRRKENASIAQFLNIEKLPDHCSPARLRDRIKDARKAAKFAHRVRNRRIAHRDLVSAKLASAEPRVSTLLSKMRRALDAIHAVLSTVNPSLGNDVLYGYRMQAFVSGISQIVRSACLIDSLLGPRGEMGEEIEMARSFLEKMGGDPGDMMAIMELREAAGWFPSERPGGVT